MQAFNKAHELLEIVNAGDFEEAADSKIKGAALLSPCLSLANLTPATFNLYGRNLHCKHIVFAGSGDNSYAGFLRQFISNTTASSPSLTLIRSFDFARDLQPLADMGKVDIVSFPHLFRDTKISPRKVKPAEPSQPLAQKTSPSTAWAAPKPTTPSVNGTAATLSSLSIQPKNHPKPAGRSIWVNSDGYRLDRPILDLDRDLALRLKKKKLCNRHHLLDDCDGFGCGHSHAGKLSGEEKKALTYIARGRPCARGVWCEDPDCFDGHRCVHGDGCYYDGCRFSD